MLKSANHELMLDGVRYASLKVYCDYLNVDYDKTVLTLDTYDITIEQIHDAILDKRVLKGKGIVFDSIKFPSFEALGDYTGLDPLSIKSSLMLGLPIDKSIYEPEMVTKYGIDHIDNIGVRVDGVIYTSLDTLCSHFKINVSDFIEDYQKSLDFLATLDKLKETLKLRRVNSSRVSIPHQEKQEKKNYALTVDMLNSPITINGYEAPSLKWVLWYIKSHESDLIVELEKGLNIFESVNSLMVRVSPKGKKTQSRRFIFDGQLFENASLFADYLGISDATLSSRISYRMSFEEITTKGFNVKRKDDNRRPTIAGLRFLNVNAVSVMAKIDIQRIALDIKNGKTIQDVYFSVFKEREQSVEDFRVGNKVFESLEDVSEHYKLKLDDVKHSFMLGLPLNVPWHSSKAVLYLGIKSVNKIGIVVFGEYYENLDAVYKVYNVGKDKMSARYAKGLDVEEAIKDIKKIADKKTVTYNGVMYKDFKSFAEAHGKTYKHAQYLKTMGYTLEQIAGDKEKPKRLSTIIDPPIEYRGKVYSSYTYIARDYNIKPVTFMARLDSGWTLDQATGVADRPVRKKKNKTK